MNNPSYSTIKGVLIDESVLNELRKIMEDKFTEVLHLYLEESVGLMSYVHAGFYEESDKLLFAVCTLKSCNNNVGAKHLGEIAVKMEALVKAGNIDAARIHLDDLQDVFSETHGQIKKYVQNEVREVAF